MHFPELFEADYLCGGSVKMKFEWFDKEQAN